MSLRPKPVFRRAEEVKEQLMEMYANDGYYFFEEYVDSLMEKSHSEIMDY
jgi:hypothetical protein